MGASSVRSTSLFCSASGKSQSCPFIKLFMGFVSKNDFLEGSIYSTDTFQQVTFLCQRNSGNLLLMFIFLQQGRGWAATQISLLWLGIFQEFLKINSPNLKLSGLAGKTACPVEDSSARGSVFTFQNAPWPLLDVCKLNVAGEGAYICQELGSIPFQMLFVPSFWSHRHCKHTVLLQI